MNGGRGGGAGYVLDMPRTPVMLFPLTLGLALALGACGPTRAVRTSAERPATLHRSVGAGAGWDVVLPSPEVAMDQRCQDRRRLPEAWRRNASLSISRPEAIDAITSSWPVAPTPSLDRERTGRTSVSPERFIYSSEYETYIWSPYRRRLYRRY